MLWWRFSLSWPRWGWWGGLPTPSSGTTGLSFTSTSPAASPPAWSRHQRRDALVVRRHKSRGVLHAPWSDGDTMGRTERSVFSRTSASTGLGVCKTPLLGLRLRGGGLADDLDEAIGLEAGAADQAP